MELMRIFAGGLPQDVENKELVNRFSKFGKVCDVEIKSKTDATGEWLKSFGYINIEITPQNFQKCKSQLNNTTWRDGKITIQLAKQSTSDKYASERKQNISSPENPKEKKEVKPEIPNTLKGAVPGTVLPDNENWVVTKFQRVVPVMNVRSKDKKKVVRYDPSRHSHQLKRLDNGKNELDDGTGVDTLTWSLGANGDADDSNYRKRMGDFTGLGVVSDKKVKRGRSAADIVAQKKAERESAINDLEVVPVDKQEEVSTGGSTSGKLNGVDLSRFDSDSDNDAEPVVNDLTLCKRNILSTKVMNSTKLATTAKPTNAAASSSKTSGSDSDSSKSIDTRPTKLTPLNSESRNIPARDVTSSSSSSDESSSNESSSSEAETTTDVKQTKRKPFPGTAAFTDSEHESIIPSTKSSPPSRSVPTKERKNSSSSSSDSVSSSSDSEDCSRSMKDPTPVKLAASQDVKQSPDKNRPPNMSENHKDVNATPLSSNPMPLITPNASSTAANVNLGGLSWDLNKLLPTSSTGTQQTPMSVTPDSLAFLLESAASILRSAAKSESHAIKNEPTSLAEQGPPPDLDLTDSSPIPPKRKKVLKSNRQRNDSRKSPPGDKSKVIPPRPAANGRVSSPSRDKQASPSGSSSDSSSTSQGKKESGDRRVFAAAPGKSSSSEDSDSSEGESLPTKKAELYSSHIGDSKHKSVKVKTSSESSSSSESSDEEEEAATMKSTISSERIRGDSSSSSDTESSADSDNADPCHRTPMSTPKSAPGDKHVSSDSFTSSDEMSDSEKRSKESNSVGSEAQPTTKLPKRPKIKDLAEKKNTATISTAEKRSLSNKKRLEALTAKKNELKSQQQAVRQSLSSTDKSSSTKRIVFDSDSDGEGRPSKKKSKGTTSVVAGENRKTLFGDSSDENDNEEEYDKMFALKAQFEGEQGAKLLNLQKTFNDDSRFKLTEKFLEADSSSLADEAEVDDKKAEHTDVTEQDGMDERRKNLEILQSIVGSRNVKLDHPTSVKTKAKKLADTPATVFRDISSMQFDPTSQSHDHLIKKVVPSSELKKAKKKNKKKEGTDPVVGSEPAPEVTKDRFFEVDVDFAKSKTVENDAGGGMTFNFLGAEEETAVQPAAAGFDMKFNFLGDKSGSSSESAEEAETVTATAGENSNKFKNPFAERKRFDDESEEDEQSDEERGSEKLLASPTKSTPTNNTVVDWFFFKPEDPRLIDGAKRFSKTLDDELLRKKWEEIRPKLVESYLMKSKRAVQKLKSNRTSIIKKRFTAKRNDRTTTKNRSKPQT